MSKRFSTPTEPQAPRMLDEPLAPITPPFSAICSSLLCLDSVQVAVKVLTTVCEMRKITIELIEGFPPFRLE